MSGLLASLYRRNLAMLTDLYEITMAYGYWKLGRQDEQAVFHLFFRKPPFGAYTIAAGLEQAIEWLSGLRFRPEDTAYLGTLQGNDGRPIFSREFLAYLEQLEFAGDVDAIPEGTCVFASEPLVRVSGSLLQCQLVETALLTLINFQTLIATKAARVCSAAGDDPVLEFGMRRAQGIDGGISAARAAYVGGCAATSNVLAGQLLGIPVKGTHAHSWVMSFADEMEAFGQYAQAMPNNCVFLVDTYDTLDGVSNAIRAGLTLKEQGHRMIGIRLDSGDLAYLSIEARRMLDEAGFKDVAIFASNELDEHVIESLKQQGAKIAVWGVGTRLVTAFDQPALGGVYKLGAIRADPSEPWDLKMKISDQTAKSTIPGILQVRRFIGEDGLFLGDMIYEVSSIGPPAPGVRMVDPADPARFRRFPSDARHEDLLVPVMRQGKCVYQLPTLQQIQQRTRRQLASLHPGHRRFLNPHEYPVGVEERLNDLRIKRVAERKHIP